MFGCLLGFRTFCIHVAVAELHSFWIFTTGQSLRPHDDARPMMPDALCDIAQRSVVFYCCSFM